MKRHPTSLADAIKTALEVEYMLGFGGQQLQIEVIKQSSEEETKKDHLDKAIENLTKKMTDTKLAAIYTSLQHNQHNNHGEGPVDGINAGTLAHKLSVLFKLQGAKLGDECSLANTTLTHQLQTLSHQKPSTNAFGTLKTRFD